MWCDMESSTEAEGNPGFGKRVCVWGGGGDIRFLFTKFGGLPKGVSWGLCNCS